MGRLDSKKTFIVTGGLGFIGSHFIEMCLKNGHKVFNIDKETYAAHTDLVFSGEYTHIKEDISKIKSIPACDIIVNFAAESHVDNSIDESFSFISSNVVGVYNILEIIKNNKIEAAIKSQSYQIPLYVQISTDEVFGDILEGFFKEEAVHTPSNPYSATKSSAEQLVVAWGRTYDMPYIITRTTNNYGKRQNYEKLIPRVITSLIKGEKVPVHGNGEYIRNWIHVEDNVNALYTIVNSGEENNCYHISANEEYSVKEIVEIIADIFGKKYQDIADFSSDRSGCDLRYALDCTKTQALGWKQKKNLRSTLKEIKKYYEDKLGDDK
jgi:dTDP-glucose 4,6-dehydratase